MDLRKKHVYKQTNISTLHKGVEDDARKEGKRKVGRAQDWKRNSLGHSLLMIVSNFSSYFIPFSAVNNTTYFLFIPYATPQKGSVRHHVGANRVAEVSVDLPTLPPVF
jgi:hypothetical protein